MFSGTSLQKPLSPHRQRVPPSRMEENCRPFSRAISTTMESPMGPTGPVEKTVDGHAYGKKKEGVRPVIAQDTGGGACKGQAEHCHVAAPPVGKNPPKRLQDKRKKRPNGRRQAYLRYVHSL